MPQTKINLKPKNVIVLLGIDDTQISSESSKEKGCIWIGGSADIWRNHLMALKKAGNERIIFHFGIATNKDDPAKYTVPADLATQRVLLDLADIYKKDLIYFTNRQSKIEFALTPAKNKIDSLMKDEDIWIIDNQVQVCDDAIRAGYRSVLLQEISKETIEKQKSRIQQGFSNIFYAYGLGAAIPKINAAASTSSATLFSVPLAPSAGVATIAVAANAVTANKNK